MNKIGEKIDQLYQLKQQRSEIQKEVDKIKKQEEVIKKEIIDLLEAQGLNGAKGKIASVAIGERVYPNILNKEEFFEWAVKNNRFEMLTKHVNQAAFREMLENEGMLPPGTDVYTEKTITSLRKI